MTSELKLKITQRLIKLHYQKLGNLFLEPKTEKQDRMIYLVENKIKELDNEEWYLIKSILKL